MKLKKCNSLANIEIPGQVKKIRSYAFNAISECPKLKRIFVGKDSYAEKCLKDNGFEELIRYK